MSQHQYEYFRDPDDLSSTYRRRKGKTATYRRSRNGLNWYHVKAENVPKELKAYIHLLEEEEEETTTEGGDTNIDDDNNGSDNDDDDSVSFNGDEEDKRETEVEEDDDDDVPLMELKKKKKKKHQRREGNDTADGGHGHAGRDRAGHGHGRDDDDDDDDDDDILLIHLARRWRQNRHDQKDATNQLKETENSLHLQEQEIDIQKQQLQELEELKTVVNATEAIKKVLPSKKKDDKKKTAQELWAILRNRYLTDVKKDIKRKKKRLQLLRKHVQNSKKERKESKQQLQNQEEKVRKTDREIYDLFAACYDRKQREIRNEGRLSESSTSGLQFFSKLDTRGMEDLAVPLRVFDKKTKKERVLGVYGDATLEPIVSPLLPPNVVPDKPSKTSVAFSWAPKSSKRFTSKEVKMNKDGYYKYNDSPQNREALTLLFSCAQELNQRFREVDVIKKVPYVVSPQTFGILQWDVQCDLPEWAQRALSLYRVGNVGSEAVTMEKYGPNHRRWVPWDVRKNPRVEQNGLVIFNTCVVSSPTLTSALEHLYLSDKTKWSRLYPKLLIFKQIKKEGWRWYLLEPEQHRTIVQDTSESTALNPFAETLQLRGPDDVDMKETQNEGVAVQVGWTGHARFVYVDHKLRKFFIYDPWMQSIDKGKQKGNKGFKELKRAIKAVGYDPEFVARPPEQGREPTCQAVAMTRLLQVALRGNVGATGPLDHVLVVLTARLLSMYAKKEKYPPVWFP
jgi:hypothetical protein